MMNKVFASSIGRQTFLILLFGLMFINIAGLSIYSFYYRNQMRDPSRMEIINQIMQLAATSHVVPRAELEHVIAAMDNPTLQLNLSANPLPNSAQVTVLSRHLIAKIVNDSNDTVSISLRTPENAWLNIKARYIRNRNWLLMTSLFTLGFLAISSLFLCAWAVRRLADPLLELVNAAKRLSIDVNAPPLPVRGLPEIQNAAQAFNTLQANIKRLLNDRTQMLAAISHDLRTPLTRLRLRAELIEDSPQSQKMISDVSEMEHMIATTLAFARDDYQEEIMERFDLEALLDSLCNDLSDMGYKLTFNGLNTRLPFLGRQNALKRAFTNLLDNAVKYGESATVNIVKKQNMINIEIVDVGPGIPDGELEKVFNPFYRVEKSRSRETGGTGLGLAVAREIIRAHGGDIILFNQPKGGLKVMVSLQVTI